MAGVKAPPRTVQLFQLTCWPMGHRVPTSTNSLVELMNMVERWRQRTDYGPVVVVSPLVYDYYKFNFSRKIGHWLFFCHTLIYLLGKLLRVLKIIFLIPISVMEEGGVVFIVRLMLASSKLFSMVRWTFSKQ